MGPVGEEEVPESQNFGEGRSARAERQDRGECVDLGRHVLGQKIQAQLRVDDGQDLVNQGQPLVDASHSAADVPRTLFGQEVVEGDEGFGFATRGVQERRG